jgi:single-stranded-DNA-specific exonuclease
MDKSSQQLPTTRWRIPENEAPDIHTNLEKELGIHPVLARILANRSIKNPAEAKKFFSPSLADLHSPFLMKDMLAGVERVIRAISRGERITIYGDYDVDGITSLVILFRFLRDAHADVRYYIPNRVDEGYSLNLKAIDAIKADGTSLIITVDCGSSDRDEIAHANSLGVDVVVLDHHEIPDVLPRAVAIINTNRSDCRFPFKDLAGVGIVFNFLIALRSKLRDAGFWSQGGYPNLKEYLDLVALGTIGDISPLTDENRIFTRIGLELINRGSRVGLKALQSACGIDSSLDSITASFTLIPRINAAGRIASPEDSIKLLLTDNPAEAAAIARKLESYNRERQSMEKAILSSALAEIEGSEELAGQPAFILSSARWHPGVIGIVASKLVDVYYRPVMLISLRNGVGKGSGRSVSEINLHEILKACDSYLLAHGGHRYAAGISIREEMIGDFRSAFISMLSRQRDVAGLGPLSLIDAQCTLAEVDGSLISQFEMLAPFGSMNPEPVLYSRQVQVSSLSVAGNRHLRMRVSGDGVSRNSIWFGKGDFLGRISNPLHDIIFTPQMNNWNGSSTIQLKIRDMAAA